MTTLIAAYNSEGCTGRCDARCYDAKGPDCDCICGGANHGVGAAKAMSNTRMMAEAMIEKYKLDHPALSDLTFDIPATKPVQGVLL